MSNVAAMYDAETDRLLDALDVPECPECNGTGKVRVDDDADDDEPLVVCECCGGTGGATPERVREYNRPID